MPATTTAARERPILFSGSMVRALLAGTKTQTRRVVKPQPNERRDVIDPTGITGNGWWWTRKDGTGVHSQPTPEAAMNLVQDMLSLWCPYGAPGGRLWVREMFKVSNGSQDGEPYIRLRYAADERGVSLKATKWKPSIHMARSQSRILLEITEVRVERIQAISEGDALAEGIRWTKGGPLHAHLESGHNFATAAQAYAFLWDEINGTGSWAENPWVWALTFKRVSP